MLLTMSCSSLERVCLPERAHAACVPSPGELLLQVISRPNSVDLDAVLEPIKAEPRLAGRETRRRAPRAREHREPTLPLALLTMPRGVDLDAQLRTAWHRLPDLATIEH